MLALMRSEFSQSHKRQDFASFLHATRALVTPSLVFPTAIQAIGTAQGSAHVAGVSLSQEQRAIEAQAAARRLAEIVLSAKTEADLAEALDEAFVNEAFDRYCELRLGVQFSLYDFVIDPASPLQVREALLASCYTVIAVTARDVAIADGRHGLEWLITALNRYAQAGLEATRNLPAQGTAEFAAMMAGRDKGEQRIEEWHKQAVESGQDIFWPCGEPHD